MPRCSKCAGGLHECGPMASREGGKLVCLNTARCRERAAIASRCGVSSFSEALKAVREARFLVLEPFGSREYMLIAHGPESKQSALMFAGRP